MTEQEELELRERAEKGRKAKIAAEFLDEFILCKRAYLINKLESSNQDDFLYESLLPIKCSLVVLREFTNWLKSNTDIGEIAESELNKNGK